MNDVDVVVDFALPRAPKPPMAERHPLPQVIANKPVSGRVNPLVPKGSCSVANFVGTRRPPPHERQLRC
ncbi:MAG: hypothetical protein CM15mP128_1800 [Methanobacteriota archaeon]|nr:MAG: hypothetical protein CM15mP128_1800 [Euryarchaeota archaeon]